MFFFFFKATATTEISALSLHDALPICAKATGAIGASAWIEADGAAHLEVEFDNGTDASLRDDA